MYNLYSFGEESIHSLPKSMFKSELKFGYQEIQTDSCLSQTLFASKSNVDNVKIDLFTEVREKFLSKQSSAQPKKSSSISVSNSCGPKCFF